MTSETMVQDRNMATTSILDDVKNNIGNRLGYFIFLLGLLAFLVYYLILTFDMSQKATWLLPRIAIVFGILFVVTDMVKVAFYNRISDVLNWDDGESDADSGEESDDVVSEVIDSDNPSGIKSLIPFGMIREVGWVIAFVAALYYIGFFTGTFIFAFAYMLTHQEQLTLNEVLKSLSLSIGIIGFLWFLFVYLMETSSIFRLGFLP